MKSKNKSFFILFASVWAVLIIWNLLTPSRTFSEEENRNLVQFPTFTMETLLDGRYMNTINDYLNDQFAGKPYWITAQSLMEYGLGKRESNQVYLGSNALITHVIAPSNEITKANVAGIKGFIERYGMKGYVMLVPSAASINTDQLPALAEIWDERTYIDSVYGQLTSYAVGVPLYDLFEEHKDEYLYYRTDHHWTSYAAFLAHNQLLDALKQPLHQENDLTVTTLRNDFLGMLHSKTGFPLVKKDTMEQYQAGSVKSYAVYDGKETTSYDSIYFPEYLEKKDKYSYFLGTVQPMVTIYTDAPTDRKLLIFKDSYSHSMVPMLLDRYSEIRLVDPRYMNLVLPANQQLIEAERYDDVLFMFTTDVFSHLRVTAPLR